LRIISGSARGRRLHPPKNSLIRPTADRVKEALFNILAVLQGDFDGCRVLDIFAGSGNLGLEALSRGAGYTVFIDSQKESATLVNKNLCICGFAERARVLESEALEALGYLERSEAPFRLVFIDPPYGHGLAEKALGYLACSRLIDEDSLVVVESSCKEALQNEYIGLRQFDRRVYGDTAIAFFRRTH